MAIYGVSMEPQSQANNAQVDGITMADMEATIVEEWGHVQSLVDEWEELVW